MPDAPDPTDRGHEHLFRPIDVDRALVELRRVQSREPAASPSSCVLCAESVNLTESLRDTPVARRAAVRDRAARAAAASAPASTSTAGGQPATWSSRWVPGRPNGHGDSVSDER